MRAPPIWKPKECRVCQVSFIPNSSTQKQCSAACLEKWNRDSGRKYSTENTYKYVSGNWYRYFGTLMNKERRAVLTRQDLLDKLEEQNGLCALSGIPLTNILEVGITCKTNASIDRIVAGGTYAPSNIQLVCSALNKFRVDTEVDEFIEFCRKVVAYQDSKK